MLTGIVIGVLSGILLGWLIFFLAAPSLMFKENRVAGEFDQIVSEIEGEIMAKGWKLPHVHDLQATMKKFDKEVNSVKVFEICHPEHSYEILSRSRERVISNMMPCRIAVYEKEDGSVWISRMNSGIVAKPMSKIIRKTMSVAAGDVEEIISGVLKD